jgi:hypothetical protein
LNIYTFTLLSSAAELFITFWFTYFISIEQNDELLSPTGVYVRAASPNHLIKRKSPDSAMNCA